VHTHFGSATNTVAAFLGVVLVGTFWRIGWSHGLRSNNPIIAGLARAAMVQY